MKLTDRGFSLLEVIVVIAILSVIALILIPISGRMAIRAESLECQSNLRMIWAGFIGYSAEHDMQMPPANYWFAPVRSTGNPQSLPYVPHYIDPEHISISRWLFKCPSVETIPADYQGGTYVYNRRWEGRRMTDALHPSRALLVTDGRKWVMARKEFVGDPYIPRHGGRASGEYNDMEGRAANGVFIDGRVTLLIGPVETDKVTFEVP